MVKDVVTVQKDVSAHDAVKLMNKNRIGCLIAVYNGEVLGILTERDLLEKVMEKCKDPKETKVSEIMTRQVVLGKPDMELLEATRLMFDNKVKRLPIVEENRLMGLITLTDIARVASVDKKTIELIDALSNMHMLRARKS
jgi:CBS domain-containing protein